MKKIFLTTIMLMFAEIATFIFVGKAIGVFPTLLLIVATSALGILLVKKRGTKSFRAMQDSIRQGQPPGDAMIDSFTVFVGGVLLVVPGFLTDIIGVLLATGIAGKAFKPVLYMWLRKKMKNSNVIIVQK
ncbi:MAG: FxsA family protein [Solibacillus sp.]